MVTPGTLSSIISQTPLRFWYHRSFMFRYQVYAVFVVGALFWQIDKVLTSDANKKLWKEKREHDHHQDMKALEKKWEIRT